MSSIQSKSLRHVAIIMDGNNRWARDRALPPLSGHQAGADRLKEIIEACRTENIEVLTVFAFSSENWQRSRQEVGGLLSLFASSLRRYRKELVENSVRLRVVGRRDRFSDRLNKLINQVEQLTQHGRRTLVIAADYGGQWDIVQAAKKLAERVAAGTLKIEEIDEQLFNEQTCLSDLPPLDLLIRTGAETRVSNFLLWQLSYAELYFTQCYWPDFDKHWFAKAIEDYYRRQRRFGTNPELDAGVKTSQSAGVGV